MPLSLIAVDDEPLALVLLEKLIQRHPEWKMVATFTDAREAADFLSQNTVELLLTDINMPDVNGLQFVRDLPDERPLVIFVTAYKEHALEGFDLDVADYLVKPVSPDRLAKALNKAAEWIKLRRNAEATSPATPGEDHFFVYSEYQQVKIVIARIRYLESMGDYVKIYLEGQAKPVLTLDRLKHFAERLHAQGFRRIHRSYVVNLAAVEVAQKTRVQVDGVWLPVGETYAEVLKAL